MPITRERNDLDKKWSWYLFLAANVLILIGCAATWMMIYRGNFHLVYLPTIICDLAAVALAAVFMWLESKDTMPKAVHFQKKWLWWYLSALIVFCAAIVFNAVYFLIMILDKPKEAQSHQWILIVYFVITGVLTLVAIGLQRYARFRIDLDMYRRKHGQNPKEADVKKEQDKANKKKAKQQESEVKASGGLLDEIDKK